MPIIHVDMLEGRSLDQKRRLASELTDAFVRSCGGEAGAVRVVINDVPPANWSIGGRLVADGPPPGG
jgi:4-oxalocrotonate tautomerase